MNKRSLIKFALVLITLLLSNFLVGNEAVSLDPLSMLIYLLFPVTLLMFFYRKSFKKHKKFQFVYDVVLIIFMLTSFLLGSYFLFSVIISISNYQGYDDMVPIYWYLYVMSIITLLLFSFTDIFKKTNKKNDILVIIISLVIIFMMFRVYIIPGFNQDIFVYYEVSKNIYNYVSEFYVYFLILNVAALIHYFINKVDLKK